MTVPPLLGSSPSRPYKRRKVGVRFFLTPSYMACDYESEAVEKFLLPSQPDEGNFTSRTAYETELKTYRCDHMRVMEAHEWWKQGERIEDACREAEAARARAAAEKERREAAEQTRKRCRLEEGEAEAGTSVECCKRCAVKGKSVCGLFVSVLIFGVGLVCVCKPNASCDECRARRTKCKYPGKTSIGAGSLTTAC